MAEETSKPNEMKPEMAVEPSPVSDAKPDAEVPEVSGVKPQESATDDNPHQNDAAEGAAAADMPAPAEKAEDDTPAVSLSELKTGLTDISSRIDELNKQFSQRISYSEHEKIVLESMHRELQEYKQDLYSQIIKPIIMDVIDVRDSIVRISSEYLKKPEGEQAIPNKTFSGYALDLQDLLERYNVEVSRSEPGVHYTPIKQRVLKKIPTADESLHGTVAESLSFGYSYLGKVLSPEKIVMYYYEKPAEAPVVNNDNK